MCAEKTDFKNTLYYGDNLDILKKLTKEYPKGLVDLIYIDPPFNSNRNYNILFEDLIKNKENGVKNKALKEAFVDTWSNVNLSIELEELKSYTDKPTLYRFLTNNREIFTNAQMSYLTMMAHRIYYMHKILKDTGSFYLHCDPTMSHYLKILLDIIFGLKNFRNEIVWKRTNNPKGSQFHSKKFGVMTDSIFFYIKSEDYYFSLAAAKCTLTKEELFKKYPYEDDNGRYYIGPILCSQSMGDRPNLCYEYKGYKNPYPSGWRMSKEKLIELDKNGDLGWTKNNTPFRKLRITNDKGNPLYSLWDDIPRLNSNSKESLGYPTQKPEALLERIIKASSNEGDIVADFFCGCGTAVTVAEKLKRKWLGVDINHLAVSLVEDKRLKPLKAIYQVEGFPKDIASLEKLAADDKHKFEEWVVEYKFKGHKTKKTGDGGIDGHIAFNYNAKKLLAVIEVKGGKVTISQIRAFKDSIIKFNADFGIFVCFKKEITKGMQQEADSLGIIDSLQEIQETNLFNEKKPLQGFLPFNIRKMYIISVEDLLEDNLNSEIKTLMYNITY